MSPGINSVVFYAPVIFSSLGMGQDSSLLSSVIIGVVFVATTVVAVLTVDKYGRKVVFKLLLRAPHIIVHDIAEIWHCFCSCASSLQLGTSSRVWESLGST